MITLQLLISFFLFFSGTLGLLFIRKNIILLIISLEIMLLSISYNLIIFSIFLDDFMGFFFVIALLCLGVCETAIALSLYICYFRSFKFI